MVKPKCRPRQVTCCPEPISPEVTPAIACSPVQSVDAICKSMLRDKSKQRSIGASIGVTRLMPIIPASDLRPHGEARLRGSDTCRYFSVLPQSCAPGRVWLEWGPIPGSLAQPPVFPALAQGETQGQREC